MKLTPQIAVIGIVTAFLTATPAWPEGAQEQRRELEEAKALYESARFDAAVVRLDNAVRRMDRVRDLELRRILLADAYLHLSLAHLALGDPVAARENMRRMLLVDRDRQLDQELYAPKVVALWESVRSELELDTPQFIPSPDDKYTKRLGNCNKVLLKALENPDWIPANLLGRASCVAVVPGVKKFAFGLGGRYGRGAVVCRSEDSNRWSPPLMISLKGISGGLQFGGQSADIVLLMMRGMDYLLKGKLTLGGDATLAVGPGAKAATDGILDAEILTYAKTRGIFVGISLEGAVVRPDHNANREVYGEAIDPWELVKTPRTPIPEAAYRLLDTVRLITSRAPSPRREESSGRSIEDEAASPND